MDVRIGRLRDEARIKLNVGCGDTHQEGSINIDLHGTPDIIADTRSLPYPDNYADLIEAHHILEHFNLNEGKQVLAEWHRVLKTGGNLIITIPDVLGILNMMHGTQNIPEVWPGMVMFLYGQDKPGMRHLSAYSPTYLSYRLKEFNMSVEVIPWPYRPTPSFGVIACKA